MTYAHLTYQDHNSTKRWFQNRRLVIASQAIPPTESLIHICDYGSGNGEFVRFLKGRTPNARFTCFEPTDVYLKQGLGNTSDMSNVSFLSETRGIESGSMDYVFCLEVFEHLPAAETDQALAEVLRILKTGGRAIIGVPVEIGLPALYKGAFRFVRRRGKYDAKLGNISRAVMAKPRTDRPTKEIAPGFHYHSFHTGFDHRALRSKVAQRLDEVSEFTSPSGVGGALWDAEIYFSAVKR